MKAIRVLAAALAVLLVVGGVAAAPALLQSVERPRAVTSAGATSVTVGDVTLRGTLGQPFVGSATSGDITLIHGFWHGVEPTHRIYLPLILNSY